MHAPQERDKFSFHPCCVCTHTRNSLQSYMNTAFVFVPFIFFRDSFFSFDGFILFGRLLDGVTALLINDLFLFFTSIWLRNENLHLFFFSYFMRAYVCVCVSAH